MGKTRGPEGLFLTCTSHSILNTTLEEGARPPSSLRKQIPWGDGESGGLG